MKRSQQVIKPRLRKSWRPAVPSVTVAAIVLVSGCSDNGKEMNIYANVTDCVDDNPGYSSECRAAYQDAVDDAASTAPKYNSQDDCASEFGYENCVRAPQNNWFMPAMAGFMFGQAINNRSYYHQPMFSSSYPGSRYYGDWVSSDGYSYGRKSKYSKVYVPKDHLKQKPAVTKTISRGGFGSKVAAKSSWSRSSSKGWGG
ncbi:hypothetical protein A1OK_18615 [Enterovibrio norvegicus FF-454]|uniref:DUF1190 domain-containing protein n=1 Tax=Enterovibrio norvegicus FF-454 TaxID=1185651 RepID=A0A1E5CE84_9GAMM|nr:DUF1190 domain-containing protein [Enterovibrio norvegicus]OEE63823.1 hypothetical protein A1OK_18615 [Enterovibrio norvegicus FF-454]